MIFFLDPPSNQFPFTLYPNKEFVIKPKTMVTTIPVLPTLYEISFDFKPTKWLKGWTSVLHMTINGNAGWGDRVPAVFMRNSRIVIYNAIDGNRLWHFWGPRLSLNKWVNIKFTQTLERHEYVSRIYIDNRLIKTKLNRKPQDFKIVDIWTSDKWYSSQPGFIRKLIMFGELFILIPRASALLLWYTGI